MLQPHSCNMGGLRIHEKDNTSFYLGDYIEEYSKILN
jgi:hypothetical protein